MSFILKPLPPQKELETKAVLKQLALAHKNLAELKGLASMMPNSGVLINTLSLQEAQDSSAIENIITTQDELFKGNIFPDKRANPAVKEVRHYASALKSGFELVRKNSLLTQRHILEIHKAVMGNDSGFRKQPGTKLLNDQTGETVYIPPQDRENIEALMTNLELFINDESLSDVDQLIKMALIHYQFESIHPFSDGNGRTGRIINVLYLVLKGLLDIPVLYLSRYIIQTKSDYYRLLQKVRNEDAWEEWVIYILKAIEETAEETIRVVKGIKELMQEYKHAIRKEFKFYSQDLINLLFSHPYTRIETLMKGLKISRITASRYLNALAKAHFVEKVKLSQGYYFVNTPLIKLLSHP